ncbi:hypothetical protein JI435_123350 [Parastagonospora nodorum SN15]|uniref:Uncharacterized protein n=1 Tax=Phaeosphaeria nodorum (strain SN15 / ATCC MYA-4574 / FGSC 10173) TaxID=321614 RepID=A0A7U2IC51_PHANO|nr:hypothetical protein JI435_123350 [Parastagonospora nodorum SN15]
MHAATDCEPWRPDMTGPSSASQRLVLPTIITAISPSALCHPSLPFASTPHVAQL